MRCYNFIFRGLNKLIIKKKKHKKIELHLRFLSVLANNKKQPIFLSYKLSPRLKAPFSLSSQVRTCSLTGKNRAVLHASNQKRHILSKSIFARKIAGVKKAHK